MIEGKASHDRLPTQLMGQHRDNLLITTVVEEGVVEDDALVLPEAVPGWLVSLLFGSVGGCSKPVGREYTQSFFKRHTSSPSHIYALLCADLFDPSTLKSLRSGNWSPLARASILERRPPCTQGGGWLGR